MFKQILPINRAGAPSDNPLLRISDFKPGERMLMEVFAHGVKDHHHELRPADDLLWLAFDVRSIVKSNHYDIVGEWLNDLMARNIGGITGVRGSRKLERHHLVGQARMGEGDALLIVSISRELIPHFLEVAALPHIPFTIKMRTEHDRTLYDLYNAMLMIEQPKPVTDGAKTVAIYFTANPVTVNGKTVLVRHSQTRPGWLNVTVDDLRQLCNAEKMDFGRLNFRILRPRNKFISNPDNTDINVVMEPVKAPHSKRVVSFDFNLSRQQALKVQRPIIDISLISLLAHLGISELEAQVLAAELTRSQVIRLYVRVQVQGTDVHTTIEEIFSINVSKLLLKKNRVGENHHKGAPPLAALKLSNDNG